MLEKATHKPAPLPQDLAPQLMVVVDTEEEFDWARPFSRAQTGVCAMAAQHRAHDIFSSYGIKPLYVVDYAVADQPAGYGPLKDLLDDGLCDIGAHLHPWVTPPHDEEVNTKNSYPGNLPVALEAEKLRRLTERITQTLGVRPTCYRAGRYGVGPNTTRALIENGYEIDLSVVPKSCFGADGGPDFSALGIEPYWFGPGGALLEIPLSVEFTGLLSPWGARLHSLITAAERARLPGLMARAGLLNRIRLSPEGIPLAEQCALTRALLRRGVRLFVLSYHSPSLAPGHTPYVRDDSGLARFLGTIAGYCDFFFNDIGGQATTAPAIRALLKAA